MNPSLEQTVCSLEKGRFSADDQSIGLAIPRKVLPNGKGTI